MLRYRLPEGVAAARILKFSLCSSCLLAPASYLKHPMSVKKQVYLRVASSKASSPQSLSSALPSGRHLKILVWLASRTLGSKGACTGCSKMRSWLEGVACQKSRTEPALGSSRCSCSNLRP